MVRSPIRVWNRDATCQSGRFRSRRTANIEANVGVPGGKARSLEACVQWFPQRLGKRPVIKATRVGVQAGIT